MGWVRRRVPLEAEALALKASVLETSAARAGAALGCCYANSREYEAELIAERRAAGAYGPKRRPWRLPVVGLAVLLAIAFSVALFAR